MADGVESGKHVGPVAVGVGVRSPQPSDKVAVIAVESQEGAAHEVDAVRVDGG